ncbi:hypothetical protein ACI0X9_003281 [Cronobacter turicensis]
MSLCKIRIGTRWVLLSPENDGLVNDNRAGLIYPAPEGLIITDNNGEPRLIIMTDEAGGFSWFVSGRKRGKRIQILPTTSEDEKDFGLDRMSYAQIIELATRTFKKCQRVLKMFK